MRSLLLAAVIPFSLSVAGCSAIPDQADLSGVDTVDIINNIRCETSTALKRYPPFAKDDDYVIGFLFNFDTETKKNLGGDATITWPIPLGTFTLGVDGGVERKRYGEENVSIAEAFSKLRNTNCLVAQGSRPHSYPITGSIGVGEVIDKYFELDSLPNAKVGEFYRTLRFTLKLDGGISPSWSLVRSSGVKIGANVDASAERTDTHEVKITITPVERELTREQKIAKNTVYVRILDGAAAAPSTRAPGAAPEAAREAPTPPTPSAADLAKERAIEDLRRRQVFDLDREIKERLEPF
jgi:hypothetical protein